MVNDSVFDNLSEKFKNKELIRAVLISTIFILVVFICCTSFYSKYVGSTITETLKDKATLIDKQSKDILTKDEEIKQLKNKLSNMEKKGYVYVPKTKYYFVAYTTSKSCNGTTTIETTKKGFSFTEAEEAIREVCDDKKLTAYFSFIKELSKEEYNNYNEYKDS